MTEATATIIILSAAVLVSCLCGLLLYRSNERLRERLTECHVVTIIMGDKLESIEEPIEQFRRGAISRDEMLMVLDWRIDRARCHLSVMDTLVDKKSPGGSAGAEGGRDGHREVVAE